jgi:hypothetical protein
LTGTEAAESGTVTEEGATEAPVSSQDNRDWETEAREMGWVPEEEYKGERKPAKFKTAQEFVEDIPPYVRKLLEKAESKAEERFKRLEKVHEKTVKKITAIHEQEMAGLKAQRKEAIKAGDVELVEQLDEELEKRRDDAPLTDDPKAKKAEAEKAFGEANPWYGSNRKMTAFARGISQDLAADKPDMTFDENVSLVLKAVREEFPEYFDIKPAANGHAAVEGGGNEPSPNGRAGPLFSKLPPEAKAQCAKDVKAGLYKNNEEWAKEYLN